MDRYDDIFIEAISGMKDPHLRWLAETFHDEAYLSLKESEDEEATLDCSLKRMAQAIKEL